MQQQVNDLNVALEKSSKNELKLQKQIENEREKMRHLQTALANETTIQTIPSSAKSAPYSPRMFGVVWYSMG